MDVRIAAGETIALVCEVLNSDTVKVYFGMIFYVTVIFLNLMFYA